MKRRALRCQGTVGGEARECEKGGWRGPAVVRASEGEGGCGLHVGRFNSRRAEEGIGGFRLWSRALTLVTSPALPSRSEWVAASDLPQMLRMIESSCGREKTTQPEAARGIERPSDAIRCNQMQSEAIRGNQRRPEALRGSQRQSEAIRGNQRQSEAARGIERQPEAIRCKSRTSRANHMHITRNPVQSHKAAAALACGKVKMTGWSSCSSSATSTSRCAAERASETAPWCGTAHSESSGTPSDPIEGCQASRGDPERLFEGEGRAAGRGRTRSEGLGGLGPV